MEVKEAVMKHDARDIANWFVRHARQHDSRSLTIMALLKLVYIAHGWHLEMYNEPLFQNRIEAWPYGPVVPDVYRAFRGQGVKVKKEVARGWSPIDWFGEDLSEEEEELLKRIYDIYGRRSGTVLSDLTHIPQGPWDITVRGAGYYSKIEDDVIRRHYLLKRFRMEEQLTDLDTNDQDSALSRDGRNV